MIALTAPQLFFDCKSLRWTDRLCLSLPGAALSTGLRFHRQVFRISCLYRLCLVPLRANVLAIYPIGPRLASGGIARVQVKILADPCEK